MRAFSSAVIATLIFPVISSAGEVLCNGIELPGKWPPRVQLNRKPMQVPYLDHPPAVIPIDVGRQLFVDDFLIGETTLKRNFHRAAYHSANPVLKPDKPWEQRGGKAEAMVFSGGAWHDPADKLFKIWYRSGPQVGTCYAQSADGIKWTKPSLDVVERGTNIVHKSKRNSSVVWLDHDATDTGQRFKMVDTFKVSSSQDDMAVYYSADGIHWGAPVTSLSGVSGDRSTVFYNPFRKVWVYSVKALVDGIRVRMYHECEDAAAGLSWKYDDLHPWVSADHLDPRNPYPALNGIKPELYNLDAVAYESLLLGLFTIWQGDPGKSSLAPDDPKRNENKRNEVLLGFSRDGFHWYRPDRTAFIGVSETKGAWNSANVQSAGGGCLIVGNKLYFYVSGRDSDRSKWINSTGLAVLRRDGFASMDARNTEGTLTTRTVQFNGKHLFINLSAEAGQLQVEILDVRGNAIEPFTRANCISISADKTMVEVRWKGVEDLSAVAGKPVQLRFTIRNGSLYSFWVSPNAAGASHGYVAAGGPGFVGPTDTVGQAGE